MFQHDFGNLLMGSKNVLNWASIKKNLKVGIFIKFNKLVDEFALKVY